MRQTTKSFEEADLIAAESIPYELNVFGVTLGAARVLIMPFIPVATAACNNEGPCSTRSTTHFLGALAEID